MLEAGNGKEALAKVIWCLKGYTRPPGCARCCENRGSPAELTLGAVQRIAARRRRCEARLPDRLRAAVRADWSGRLRTVEERCDATV